MAEKEENNLIGFDPLAWMNDESTATNGSTKNTDTKSETSVEKKQESEDVDNIAEEVGTEEIVEVKTETLVEPVGQQNESISDDCKITLEATLNIQNVTDLYERLIKLLESNNQIEIDASAVVSIDTATLQLLIVLKQTAIKLHKEVIIDFPSDRFIEAAELLGLSEMLEVDQAAAGFF